MESICQLKRDARAYSVNEKEHHVLSEKYANGRWAILSNEMVDTVIMQQLENIKASRWNNNTPTHPHTHANALDFFYNHSNDNKVKHGWVSVRCWKGAQQQQPQHKFMYVWFGKIHLIVLRCGYFRHTWQCMPCILCSKRMSFVQFLAEMPLHQLELNVYDALEQKKMNSIHSIRWRDLNYTSRSTLGGDHHNIKWTFLYACIIIHFASSHMWWLFWASVLLSDYEWQRRLRCKQTSNFETLSSIWTLKVHIIMHGYFMPNRHYVYWYNAGKMNCTYYHPQWFWIKITFIIRFSSHFTKTLLMLSIAWTLHGESIYSSQFCWFS